MACNAFNHPPGCDCGWGGVFYGRDEHGPNPWNSTRAYTTPNAICSQCGQKVFFYKNDHGSQVYFDALGPPWPLHACFSEGLSRRKQVVSDEINLLQWTPIEIISVGRGLGALTSDDPSRKHFQLFLQPTKSDVQFSERAPWYLKASDSVVSSLSVSTVVTRKDAIRSCSFQAMGWDQFKQSTWCCNLSVALIRFNLINPNL